MHKIIVFGATGGTGKLVVEQALEAGHHVTVVVRNPGAFTIQHQQLEVIKGDVFHAHTFENAMKDKDTVVSCLGIQKREPTTVYSEGVSNIVNTMQKSGVKRIICLSAAAVVVPPKGTFMTKFIAKNILQRIFKYSFADMLLMEKMLPNTNLNWTIIRPPRLLSTKPKGKYRVTINEPIDNPNQITRSDLAEYIVTHLDDKKTFKGLVEVSE